MAEQHFSPGYFFEKRSELFIKAAEDGNLDAMKANFSSFALKSAFSVAFSSLQVESIRFIVEALQDDDNDPSFLDSNIKQNKTAFYIACEEGHQEIVALLLPLRYVDVNKTGGFNRSSSLEIACRRGHIEVVRMLLSSPRIDLNIVHSTSYEINDSLIDEFDFPLRVACLLGRVEIVKLFLACGRKLVLEFTGAVDEDTIVTTHCLDRCNDDVIKSLIQRYGQEGLIRTLRSSVGEEFSPQIYPLPWWANNMVPPVGSNGYSFRTKPVLHKQWTLASGCVFVSSDKPVYKFITESSAIESAEFKDKNVWVEVIDFYQSQNLPSVAQFRPGTEIITKPQPQKPEAHLKYLGHTIDDDMILKDATGNLIVDKWSVARYHLPNSLAPEPRNISDNFPEIKYADELLEVLKVRTILGEPLLELLDFIHCRTPNRVPIAIVGGAIRDILQGKSNEIQDIDLVIARPWNSLERDIGQFFAGRNVAATSRTLLSSGIRKGYGMMKLNGTDADAELFRKKIKYGEVTGGHDKPIAAHFDLDIGLFKAQRIDSDILTKLPKQKKSKQNYYLYGYSYKDDTLTRDFSVNAVYFDVFTKRFVDPTGHGIADMMASPRIIRVTVETQPQLKKDVGGRFRLWKMLLKKVKGGLDGNQDVDEYIPQPEVMPIWICRSLRQEAELYNVDNNAQPHPDAESWLRKFATKLWKGPGSIKQLRECVIRRSYHQEMIKWWNATRALCARVINFDSPYFADMVMDDENDLKVWRICHEMASAEEIPNTVNSDISDDAIDSFLSAGN